MLDLNEIEILQVALAHEERARAFYVRMADRHGDSTAGELFAFLSREEEGHIRRLTGRYGIPEFEKKWEEKFLPYLIDLDRLAWEEGVGTQYTAGPEAVRRGLEIARKAELHAIAFYGLAGKTVEDKSTRTLLAELEEEERNHLAKIEGYLADLPGGDRMPDNPMDVIRMALDREKVAYRNYTEYARIATQPEIRELFQYLAGEEKKHAKLLSDEIEKETHQEM